MMSIKCRSTSVALLLIAALLALTLGAQAVADAMVPPGERSNTVQAMGRAGFSYLSGLRTFAAAILWNRLEPVLHSYYQGTPLAEQLYVLPTFQIVVALDPTLSEPYFIGSWIIARAGRVDEGLTLAKKGVENNPKSGVLLAGYAQMILIMNEDPEGALQYAEALLEPDIQWRSLEEQFEGYAVLRDVYKLLGRTEDEAMVRTEMDHIGELISAGGGETQHDHDDEE